MSYKLETQYNSPNFTPENEVYATWGRGRTIEAIAIHWWGDPNTGPSYEGTVATLVNPNRGASAHFVATGTGRRAAQLVNFQDASWATNSANPYTVSIECDPRCRDEDYDVVAELIAQIRSAYGYLPLVPHRQFVATACPGNYDLDRLNALANTKDGSGDWGSVPEAAAPAPVPEPTPVEPSTDALWRVFVNGKQVAAYSVEQNAYNGYVGYGSTGTILFGGNDVTQALISKYAPVVVTPPAETVPEPTESLPVPSEPQSGTITPPETTTLLEDLIRLWNKFVAFLSKYKRSK